MFENSCCSVMGPRGGERLKEMRRMELCCNQEVLSDIWSYRIVLVGRKTRFCGVKEWIRDEWVSEWVVGEWWVSEWVEGKCRQQVQMTSKRRKEGCRELSWLGSSSSCPYSLSLIWGMASEIKGVLIKAMVFKWVTWFDKTKTPPVSHPIHSSSDYKIALR